MLITRRDHGTVDGAVALVALTLPVAFVLHDLEGVVTATWWTRQGPAILRHAHPRLPDVAVERPPA
jgi:hypothetical protein